MALFSGGFGIVRRFGSVILKMVVALAVFSPALFLFTIKAVSDSGNRFHDFFTQGLGWGIIICFQLFFLFVFAVWKFLNMDLEGVERMGG
jgi:uncharacterized membrane-anchored protein